MRSSCLQRYLRASARPFYCGFFPTAASCGARADHIVYDASTLWLRVVSLLIPFPFALTLTSRRWHHFGIWSMAAFALATTAVWA